MPRFEETAEFDRDYVVEDGVVTCRRCGHTDYLHTLECPVVNS